MRLRGDRASGPVDPGAWLRALMVCFSLAIALPASSLAQDEGLQLLPPLGDDDGLDQGVGGKQPGEERDGETTDGTASPGVADPADVGQERAEEQAAGPASLDSGISAGVPEERESVQKAGSSSLLGYLDDRKGAAAPVAPEPGPAGAAAALSGCPRSVLEDLLTAATAKADVVSSLEIEREVLTFCAERQALVVKILQAEEELGRLWQESRGPGPEVQPEPADVLAQLTAFEGAQVVEFVEEPLEPEPEPVPEPPRYGWFAIFGVDGDLQARVSDGREVWFVREGDELPGGVVVDWIAVSPPGVHVVHGGEDELLPYRPAQGGGG